MAVKGGTDYLFLLIIADVGECPSLLTELYMAFRWIYYLYKYTEENLVS